MGGVDKPLLPLASGTVLSSVVGRLLPQCASLAINANGDPARFAAYHLPVLPDIVAGFPGPLAGVLTGLAYVKQQSESDGWLLTAPGDTPFIPDDLAQRLGRAVMDGSALIACTQSGGRPHPVVALWSSILRDRLAHALVERGVRGVMAFQAEVATSKVEWPVEPHDPFFNINTPEDLTEAERRLAASETKPF
jgi:molybdopterin-guanine dinucleotide biosynthesis protein A